MSYLTSKFDVLRGIEGKEGSSALVWDFVQASGVSPDISEGTVVSVVASSTPAAANRHTSTLLTGGNWDHPWLVIRGKESAESQFVNKLTCAKLRTGFVFKVATNLTPAVNDLIWANAGALTNVDPTGGIPHIGKVIAFDADNGFMVVES
jgi:hypothetical protein